MESNVVKKEQIIRQPHRARKIVNVKNRNSKKNNEGNKERRIE